MNSFTRHPRPHENLAKRDDNYRPQRYASESAWRFPRFYIRKRRLFLLVLAALLVWAIWSSSSTRMQDGDYNSPGKKWHTFGQPQSISESLWDQLNYNLNDPASQNYAGPIKLPRLTDSLYSAPGMGSYAGSSQSILFAASSLNSISRLLPLACEMARWERNFVHFIVLSRESLSLSIILEVNGVYQKACPLFMHDGRPEYPEHSTDKRAKSASRYAMDKTLYRVQAQAIITDDFENENTYFTQSVKQVSKEDKATLIQIPMGDIRRFFWMTRLGGESLSAWDKPSIDILVPVQSGTSGSLSRLLGSLRAADYSGFRIPRLILDLPAKLDASTREVLDELVWPPGSEDTLDVNNQLILRHKVLQYAKNSKEASINFLESFWPTAKRHSHVLLLSPKAELSPLFYHYLHYVMLAYQYSRSSRHRARSILGINLEAPSAYLNGTVPFAFPKVRSMPPSPRNPDYGDGTDNDSPFLWESSNMNTLIFGDKWKELHSFVNSYTVKERLKSYEKTTTSQGTMDQPAWIKHLLELMQARGYTVFHPAVQPQGKLAITSNDRTHNHQAHLSESSFGTDESEMSPSPLSSSRGKYGGSAPDTFPSLSSLSNNENMNDDRQVATNQQFLHEILALDGDLPEISHLSIMSHQGNLLKQSEAKKSADDFANWFRESIGGCPTTAISDGIDKYDENDVNGDNDDDEDDIKSKDGNASLTPSPSLTSTFIFTSAFAETDDDTKAAASLLGKKDKKDNRYGRQPGSALDLFCFNHNDDVDKEGDEGYFTQEELY